MRKKLTIVLTVVVMLVCLCACGAEPESGYDEATNQQISFHGTNFQIPATWMKQVEEEDNLLYGEMKDDGKNFVNCLTARFNEDSELNDYVSAVKDGLKLGNEKYGYNIGEVSQSDVTISNKPAIRMDYEEYIKGKKYMVISIYIQVNEDIIGIGFVSPNKLDCADFEKVLGSIEIK